QPRNARRPSASPGQTPLPRQRHPAPSSGGFGGPGRFKLPSVQRSPPPTGAAFSRAIVLRGGIGPVPPPHPRQAKKKEPVAATQQIDPRAAPPIPASAWGGQRTPGAFRNVVIRSTDDAEAPNRTALRYVYAQRAHQALTQVTIPA